MAEIKSPNEKYNGVSASITFNQGVGHTDVPHLIEWFKEQGYEVTEEVETVKEEIVKEDEVVKEEDEIVKEDEVKEKKANKAKPE